MDQVVSGMKLRFLQHGNLYKDFSCLDPRRFCDFKKTGVPDEALKKLCEVSGFAADHELIKEQLSNFSEAFPRLAMTLSEEYQRDVEGRIDGDDDIDTDKDDDDDDENGCGHCVSDECDVLMNNDGNDNAFSEKNFCWDRQRRREIVPWRFLIVLCMRIQGSSCVWT